MPLESFKYSKENEFCERKRQTHCTNVAIDRSATSRERDVTRLARNSNVYNRKTTFIREISLINRSLSDPNQLIYRTRTKKIDKNNNNYDTQFNR